MKTSKQKLNHLNLEFVKVVDDRFRAVFGSGETAPAGKDHYYLLLLGNLGLVWGFQLNFA